MSWAFLIPPVVVAAAIWAMARGMTFAAASGAFHEQVRKQLGDTDKARLCSQIAFGIMLAHVVVAMLLMAAAGFIAGGLL